jgi:hypothetical protein
MLRRMCGGTTLQWMGIAYVPGTLRATVLYSASLYVSNDHRTDANDVLNARPLSMIVR